MNRRALMQWLQRNRPDLHAEFFPMNMDAVRVKLNAITGLAVPSSEPIETGSAAYLQRLIEMSQAVPAGAVDNRLASLHADAARYRWLCDNARTEIATEIFGWEKLVIPFPEWLDDAIDKEIEKDKLAG